MLSGMHNADAALMMPSTHNPEKMWAAFMGSIIVTQVHASHIMFQQCQMSMHIQQKQNTFIINDVLGWLPYSTVDC
jgi:hypothetical protein